MSVAPAAAARPSTAVARAGAARGRSWPAVVIGLAAAAWALALAGLAVEAADGTPGRVSWPDFMIALAFPAVACWWHASAPPPPGQA